jgi:hypothetical protein
MPPAKPQTSNTVVLSVKVPTQLDDILRDYAERELVSRSDIVRRALLNEFETDLAQLEAS